MFRKKLVTEGQRIGLSMGQIQMPRQEVCQSMRRGHMILKNPFYYMQPDNQKELQLQTLVVGHVIGIAIFVAIPGLAPIAGLGNIFWAFQVKE